MRRTVGDVPKDKPIKLPDDFEQTLKDLLATGPTPTDEKPKPKPDKPKR